MGSVLRLSRETIGILADDRSRQVVHIPAGAELSISGDLTPDPREKQNHQLLVHWDGKAVLVFACDLRERGQLVSRAPA